MKHNIYVMRKFTKLIENNLQQNYIVSADITMEIDADNEGEATYKANEMLDENGYVIHYTISSVQKMDQFNEQVESTEWLEVNGFLRRKYEFDNFKESIDFVNKVAELSEKEQHHPRINIKFNEVTLLFKTNKENKITELDHEMAKKVDDIYNN